MSDRPTPRPPQRHSPQVYRRRRLVVLTLLLLLIGGLVAGGVAVKKHFFPSAPSQAQEQPEEPAGPTEEDLANPRACATEVLDLQVRLAADSLPAGQATTIPLTVRNTGEVPCLIDMSRETIRVDVSSGDDPVWSSRHCGGDLPEERRLLLDVDASDTTNVTWPGTRSAAGCPGEQPRTTAGTYRLHVALETESGSREVEQVFGLH